MANYAILRMEKRKLASVGRICKHHERLKDSYKSNPDIDPTRTHLNFHIIAPHALYRNEVFEKIEAAGAKRRKDSIVMEDCYVGATPDWIMAKPLEEQAAYFRHAEAFFEQKIGKENIISAVVHMDEKTPHMHLCFVPLTPKGRLSAKEIIGGPAGLCKWQDEFHEHMLQKYPDLTRGTPARITHRKHIPVYMFKCAGELYDHYEEILQAINDIGVFNSGKKKDAAIALLGKYAPQMAKLTDQLKTTDKYIEELERTGTWQRSEIRDLKSAVYDKEVELEYANDAIYKLNRKQKELEQLIAKVPPRVFEWLEEQERERKRQQNRGWER